MSAPGGTNPVAKESLEDGVDEHGATTTNVEVSESVPIDPAVEKSMLRKMDRNFLLLLCWLCEYAPPVNA